MAAGSRQLHRLSEILPANAIWPCNYAIREAFRCFSLRTRRIRSMAVTVRSFAKINLGLAIGAPQSDRFHALETIYQTLAVHDLVRVEAARGNGIEIRCKNPQVPCDESNTCYRVADRMLRHWK